MRSSKHFGITINAFGLSIVAVILVLGIRMNAQEITYRNGRIELFHKLPDPVIQKVQDPVGNNYVTVELAEHGSRAEPGRPALPIIDFLIETSRNDPLPRVLLKKCTWENVPLAFPVRPAHTPVPKIPGASVEQRFQRNAQSYEGNGFRNSQLEKFGSWYRLTPVRKAKRNYIRLELFLYGFDPSSLRLKYPKTFTILLSWVDGPAVTRPYARPRPGPVSVLSVEVPTLDRLRFLSERNYDIAGRRGDSVTVYATPEEIIKLEKSGFDFKTLPNDAPKKAQMINSRKTQKSGELGIYHSYDELSLFLEDLETEYADICQVESLGQSVQGREIWAVKISDNVTLSEDEPRVRLVSTMHGDEPVGTEMCLYFMDDLLSRYSDDTQAQRVVNGMELWIVPLLNPDGYTAGTRYNANSVDLNRAFPDRINDPVNSPEGREPEVAAIMQLSGEQCFALAANFHTGALVVNYPYDSNDSGASVDTPTPDDALFQGISLSYSELNPPMFASAAFSNGVTNGALWYVIYGGMQDWSYVWEGTNEVTIELSNTKWPDESALSGLWDDNRDSMYAYVETVFTAVSGFVRDAATDEIIPGAVVTVEGINHALGVCPSNGRYHRMLEPGVYTLTFTAPGYEPEIVSEVSVAGGDTTELSVTLTEGEVHSDESVLVVADESLNEGAQEMVDYYNGRGFSCSLISLSGSPSNTTIRDLIRTQYQTTPF